MKSRRPSIAQPGFLKFALRLITLTLMSGILLSFTSLTDSSFAQPPSDKYGAIAYCKTTKFWGRAYDFPNREQAEHRAVQECRNAGGRNCRAIVWYKNNCAAIAVSKDNRVFWSYGPSRSKAHTLALEKCSETASGCKIITSECSSK